MLPTVVIVGRPNVGKSTLFNRLTQSRAALVADFPGLTRDRHYGRGLGGERPYLVVDTGGFEPKATTGIMHAMAKQTRTAIAEADVVVFLVDGREGLTPQDKVIADLLRRSGRPLLLAVNKAEGLAAERVTAEFHELALGTPLPISSAHGENVRDLVDTALALCPAATPDAPGAAEDDARRIKVAIVGRPERRQVDADQHAARRGTRDRVRPAGHDARFALSGFRPRRSPLHAHRHGRRAQARQGHRRHREIFRDQDAAGDRGRQRRHPAGRRAGGHFGAGRAHRRLHPGSRPRADHRRQQMGRPGEGRRASRSSAISAASSRSCPSPSCTRYPRATARASARC